MEFFVIKMATPFLYHMTTNLTSSKNARGSKRLVRKLLQSGPADFSAIRLFAAEQGFS